MAPRLGLYHSSCHAAMADDALDANKMNVNPGGKQRKMRDTTWQGKDQKMCFVLGILKGMRQVLQEREVNTDGMNGDEMRKILAGMDDFKNEKSLVKHYLIHKGHITVFLPKFHPELNPIERVWAQLKRYKKVIANTRFNHYARAFLIHMTLLHLKIYKITSEK